MQTITTHGSFDEALAGATPAVQDLARRLRRLIEQVYPAADEVPWAGQRIVGYGIGPKKNTEHFCYIGLYRNHVNLGFNHGAVLDDPGALLGGTGRRFRHVRVNAPAVVDQPALRRLVEAAVAERQAALGREA